MILAVSSIYEACQPDRKANIDSAALPSPLERAIHALTDTCEQLQHVTIGKETERISSG
jgi:hypothetical protein